MVRLGLCMFGWCEDALAHVGAAAVHAHGPAPPLGAAVCCHFVAIDNVSTFFRGLDEQTIIRVGARSVQSSGMTFVESLTLTPAHARPRCSFSLVSSSFSHARDHIFSLASHHARGVCSTSRDNS